MPAPYLGRCVCGAVRYRLTAEPLTLYACHCTDCQALGGGAFRLSMPVLRDAIELTHGRPEAFEYTPIGVRTKRATRCAACSTWLWGDPERMPQIRILRPSTLEDRSWLDPVAHIWVRSAQPWVRIPDGALTFEGQPPDERELVRAWTSRRATAVDASSSSGHAGVTPEGPDFDGCVIGESLRDSTLIDQLRVWRTWISPHAILSDDRGTMAVWHIHWVTCSAIDIDRVQRQLKPWRWYAHFWRANQMVVVYCDARFDVDRFDRSTWTPAIEHGRAKGIPDDQLDFLIIDHDA